MVDTSFDIDFDTKEVKRRGVVTRVVRRRRWSAVQKGRIVAEAVAPGAVIADVARRHDLMPQHLSNWIRAAKSGQFALPGEVAFVAVSVEAVPPAKMPAKEPRFAAAVEIGLADATLRVGADVDPDLLTKVLTAIRRSA